MEYLVYSLLNLSPVNLVPQPVSRIGTATKNGCVVFPSNDPWTMDRNREYRGSGTFWSRIQDYFYVCRLDACVLHYHGCAENVVFACAAKRHEFGHTDDWLVTGSCGISLGVRYSVS